MKAKLPLVVLSLALSLPAMAQDEKLLRGSQINKDTLVDLLTPEPRTRNIGLANQAPVKRPSAPLMIIFVTNSAELTPGAKKRLDSVGEALNTDKLSDFKFDIEGHADPRGGEEFNQQLSQARAESVQQYLVLAHHVGQQRLKAIGKGDRELLNVKNPTAEENRRVTIKTVVE